MMSIGWKFITKIWNIVIMMRLLTNKPATKEARIFLFSLISKDSLIWFCKDVVPARM